MVRKRVTKRTRKAAVTTGREKSGHAATRAQDYALFLAELRKLGKVCDAAAAVPVSRNTVYEWRREDEAFKAAWDEALEASREPRRDRGTEELEDRVFRGIPEPVISSGQPQYTPHLADGTWCHPDDPGAVKVKGKGRKRPKLHLIPMVLYRKEFAPLHLYLKSVDPQAYKDHVAHTILDERTDPEEVVLVPNVRPPKVKTGGS